jgi:hypothetical protein
MRSKLSNFIIRIIFFNTFIVIVFWKYIYEQEIVTYQYINLSELKKSFNSHDSLKELPCNISTESSVCFFKRRFCHPGFTGEFCTEKLENANPWYTHDCPNLKEHITFDENMPLSMLSSGKNCPNEKSFKGASKCAYLCFSHELTGVAQIPLSLWKIVQQNEFNEWKKKYLGTDDRGKEHIEGFGNYERLPQNLGKYLEIGCGPYTQTQFIINHTFESITLLDPGADNYIKHTAGCTYKDGALKGKKVDILSFGGEKLGDKKYKEAFDTIMAINVVEHIWDAFKFFNNIFNTLRPGGILIYHDRFYPFPSYGDKALGKSI